MNATDVYTVRCWNCLNEFEAIEAVWCSCDPKHPTKLCPFCLSCFCMADEAYKQTFWENAPQSLKDEVSMLERSLDRLGDILIRNQKLKTPQLLEALQEQEKTGGLLGKILIERGWVTQADIDAALKYQGYQPLVDTQGLEVTPAPSAVQDNGGDAELLEHLLGLAARKGASDIHLEPVDDNLTIKLRIDGLFYRIKPLSKSAFVPMLSRIYEVFELDDSTPEIPQKGHTMMQLEGHDFDLLVQTLPTRLGTSVTIKLVDRRFFLKNFTALGMKPADQMFTRAGARRAVGAHHADLAPVQRLHDDLLLADGSGSEVRASRGQHRALHPMGRPLCHADRGEPGEGRRLLGGSALRRRGEARHRLPPRAQ